MQGLQLAGVADPGMRGAFGMLELTSCVKIELQRRQQIFNFKPQNSLHVTWSHALRDATVR